jgi:UDP-2-acetamido-3-amino-2,3-dideoxy-glucuronate N-acetyltransferase
VIDETADVDPSAHVGQDTLIWGHTQVREHARIGSGCRIGRAVYVDSGVVLGDRCKVQNAAQLYAPARIGNGVFIGPCAVLTNDRHPRAVSLAGDLLAASEWTATGVEIDDFASVGAGAIILAGVHIGVWAMVAAGATVAEDIPAYALVAGTPARRIGWVGRAGVRLFNLSSGQWQCPLTGEIYTESSDELTQA